MPVRVPSACARVARLSCGHCQILASPGQPVRLVGQESDNEALPGLTSLASIGCLVIRTECPHRGIRLKREETVMQASRTSLRRGDNS
jgi:hypothetical protein